MNIEKTRNYLKKYDLGKLFLYILSLFYFLICELRKFLYFSGFLKSYSLKTPIICFGNISSGGTGKTSAVIEAARLIRSKGLKAAVITSGYAREKKKKETIILKSEEEKDISLCGDEAMVIKDSLLPLKVPVLINSKKTAAAYDAEKYFSPDYILMDDGFQHFALKRTFDFVLINSTENIREKLLPYGNLRETYSAIKRASAVILTHCELSTEDKISAFENKIKKSNPSCTILKSEHVFEKIYRPYDGKTLGKEEYENTYFSLFSAIGDPESFERSVSSQKIKIKRAFRYPDHRNFSKNDLKLLSETCSDTPILTTYKDFVRLPQYWKDEQKEKLHVFSIRLKFLSDGENSFFKILGI